MAMSTLKKTPPMTMGKYLYCVIGDVGEKSFGAMGFSNGSGEAAEIYTVSAAGLACVVSDSPVKEYELSRENLLVHQKVNECVLKNHVLLPVKFCTIAETTEQIVQRFLEARAEELRSKIEYLKNKQEYGVRVFWKEMQHVYKRLIDENPRLQKKRDHLNRSVSGKKKDQAVLLGQEVKRLLDQKKKRMAKDVFQVLTPLAVDTRRNDAVGDRMVLNDAFLIETDCQDGFDQCVIDYFEKHRDLFNVKYVGPVPPSNFVEIVVNWEKD